MQIPLKQTFKNKLPATLIVAWLFLLLFFTAAHSDPYPPYWDNVGGPPAADPLHFGVAGWPGTDAFDLSAWIPVYHNGATDNDPRTSDPSNGGTRPQNYANVSSSCTDTASPSVYWAFDDGGDADPTTGTIFFRWRVEQIANTYATGPSPGSFSSSDVWNSALWTVFIDTDGDGFREFAMHLDGSSGSPSTQIDWLAAIYSDTPSQSLDYENDPNINLLTHNPTA
ncbi:MAG: hypothetical protein R3297_08320, partial [Desulfobulbales bacterium]|nr:hypothetical protein [Desulfobulbales bacterium]